jgi:nucleoside-diphosphate-sugar epimerase
MRLAVTGGTGLVGRFVVEEALSAGDTVTVLSRIAPAPGFFSAPVAHRAWDLSETPDLSGLDALVHCAFAHVPGRYRGGEGDDPAGFRAANAGGFARLIAAAERAGVGRIVSLSSRAVYGPHPPGTVLTEETPCRPDTLYGTVKLEGERALAACPIPAVSLRATGVYGPPGPGQRHKWADLFDAFARGEAAAPRIGSEVHGADLAAAVRLALTRLAPGAYCVSDILLDRSDLLYLWSEISGVTGPVPPPVPQPGAFNAMSAARLRGAGWQPGGMARLAEALAEIAGDRQGLP